MKTKKINEVFSYQLKHSRSHATLLTEHAMFWFYTADICNSLF